MSEPTHLLDRGLAFLSIMNWHRLTTLMFFLSAMGSGLMVEGEESEPLLSFSPVSVALVSENNAISPGAPFTIGLHQTIATGYHTYWRNPGTVGLATSIEWHLPPGFTASPIQWPTPQTSKMADYTVWAYKQEALLLTTMTPPKRISTDQVITIEAKVSWMGCSRQCYPGFKELTIALPVNSESSPSPQWQPRFQQVRNQQPRSFPDWEITTQRSDGRYVLSLKNVQTNQLIAARSLMFFGYQRQVSSAKGQTWEQVSDGYRGKLHHEEFGGEDRSMLKGILVSDRPWHPDFPSSPMLIDVPVHNLAKAEQSNDAPNGLLK